MSTSDSAHAACVEVPITADQESMLVWEEGIQSTGSRPFPFHNVRAYHLNGPIDMDALQGALNGIVRRHGCLRASFVPSAGLAHSERVRRVRERLVNGVLEPGLYCQRVHEDAVMPLCVRQDDDTNSMPLMDAALELQQREFWRTFDYATPPLMRVVVARRTETEHLLVVVAHHLVNDWRSFAILASELRYQISGSATVRDWHYGLKYEEALFAISKATCNAAFESAVAYWREQWERFEPAQLQAADLLPPGRSVGPSLSRNVASVALSGAELEVVTSRARQLRVTIQMLLVAALGLALWRLTGRQVNALWSPFDARWKLGIGDVMGWFTHNHLLGFEVDPDGTIQGHLDSVRQRLLGALEHSQASLSAIRPWPGRSKPVRGKVTFNFLDLRRRREVAPAVASGAPELRVLPFAAGLIRDDIEWLALLDDDKLQLSLRCPKLSVESSAVSKLLQVYEDTLKLAIRHPQMRIRELNRSQMV